MTLSDEMGIDLGFRDSFPGKLIIIIIMNTHYVLGID